MPPLFLEHKKGLLGIGLKLTFVHRSFSAGRQDLAVGTWLLQFCSTGSG